MYVNRTTVDRIKVWPMDLLYMTSWVDEVVGSDNVISTWSTCGEIEKKVILGQNS